MDDAMTSMNTFAHRAMAIWSGVLGTSAPSQEELRYVPETRLSGFVGGSGGCSEGTAMVKSKSVEK
jgi:hypothetical protein